MAFGHLSPSSTNGSNLSFEKHFGNNRPQRSDLDQISELNSSNSEISKLTKNRSQSRFVNLARASLQNYNLNQAGSPRSREESEEKYKGNIKRDFSLRKNYSVKKVTKNDGKKKGNKSFGLAKIMERSEEDRVIEEFMSPKMAGGKYHSQRRKGNAGRGRFARRGMQVLGGFGKSRRTGGRRVGMKKW